MRPTIADLEAILANPNPPPVQIQPDGSITAGLNRVTALYALYNRLLEAIGFDPEGPCPICDMNEGCDHSLRERVRYSLPPVERLDDQAFEAAAEAIYASIFDGELGPEGGIERALYRQAAKAGLAAAGSGALGLDRELELLRKIEALVVERHRLATANEAGLERLGGLVDRLDNAAAAAVLPIPDHIHKEALTSIVGDVRDELKAFLVERGFNPWSDAP